MEGGQNLNVRRVLGTSPILQYAVTANSIKVFKFFTVELVRESNGIK
jgi:hypothetical protein